MSVGLLIPSIGFKPFRYPEAYAYWEAQQKMHWMHSEVPLGDDVKDWLTKLTDSEKNFLTQVFRFFVQADIDVHKNYEVNYSQIFKPTEVRMMLSAFANMETVHVAAYAHLIETIGMPDSEYSAFLKYKEMEDKHNFIQAFTMDNDADVLIGLAANGAFTEGLQLFASFAMILAFPATGLMNGVGQIVTLSVRDESLHCEGMLHLFHKYAEETGAYTQEVKDRIVGIAKEVVALEDAFIDLAFEMGNVRNLKKQDVKKYVRYVCDQRLVQLHLPTIFNIKEHPLPWLPGILNGVEHANFFEVKSTEYSKASSTGTWEEAWAQTRY